MQKYSTTLRDRLIVENENLVHMVAWKYARLSELRGYDLYDRYEDLVSYLLVKLVESVDAYILRPAGVGEEARSYLYIALNHDAINYHSAGHDDILGRPACAGVAVRSLDAPLPGCTTFCLADVLADNSGQAHDDRDYGDLYVALDTLGGPFRDAVSFYFGLPGYGRVGFLSEDARRLGVKTNTLHKRAGRGVTKLRQAMAAEVQA